jgi:hypoxanthine phosphoribosyltransferase
MRNDIARVLITEEALKDRVSALAAQIAKVYPNPQEGITIVTVLAGAIIFLGDLIRQLPIKMKIALVSVSSYPGKTTGSKGARLTSAALPDLAGRDVLIVDDILDSGGTMRLVQAEVRRAEPRSLRTAVLLRKPDKAPSDIPVDFVGFDVEDAFVVGYGLDYGGLYRNLPYVAVLRPELYAPESSS